MIPGAALLARAEAFAERHERALSVLAAVWFWVAVADTAGFIALPTLPRLGENFWIYVGAGWNAVWWGFLRPALLRRREVRRAAVDGPPETAGTV